MMHAAGKTTAVLKLLARMILPFAILAGTIHAPVAAHEGAHEVQAVHAGMTAIDMLADHHDAPPADSSGDNVHHHHCPAAIDAPAPTLAEMRIDGGALPPVHPIAALIAFSQAPPTEPPSA